VEKRGIGEKNTYEKEAGLPRVVGFSTGKNANQAGSILLSSGKTPNTKTWVTWKKGLCWPKKKWGEKGLALVGEENAI